MDFNSETVVTIRELYEWAKQNNCLDDMIYKHCNFDLHQLRAYAKLTDVPAYGNIVVID